MRRPQKQEKRNNSTLEPNNILYLSGYQIIHSIFFVIWYRKVPAFRRFLKVITNYRNLRLSLFLWLSARLPPKPAGILPAKACLPRPDRIKTEPSAIRSHDQLINCQYFTGTPTWTRVGKMTPWAISIFRQSTDYQPLHKSAVWQRVQNFVAESGCRMFQEAGAQGGISGTARHKSTPRLNICYHNLL